jgi:hypothetical protein
MVPVWPPTDVLPGTAPVTLIMALPCDALPHESARNRMAAFGPTNAVAPTARLGGHAPLEPRRATERSARGPHPLHTGELTVAIAFAASWFRRSAFSRLRPNERGTHSSPRRREGYAASRSSRAATLLYEPARTTTRQPSGSGAMACYARVRSGRCGRDPSMACRGSGVQSPQLHQAQRIGTCPARAKWTDVADRIDGIYRAVTATGREL